MNMKRTILGIAVVAMGVSANAVTQKFTEEELAYMPATAQIGVQVIANTYDDLEAYRVAAALSKTLPQNYRDGRFPDFRNRK